MTAKTLEEEADLRFHINRAELWIRDRVLLGDQKETVFTLMVASRILLKRDKEIEELRKQLDRARKAIDAYVADEEHFASEIASLRAKLKAVPVEEIRAVCEWELGLDFPDTEAISRWLSTVTK